MGAVDAEALILRGGSELTAVWGELDTKNPIVYQRRKQSGTGSDAEHPSSGAIRSQHFSTVAREISIPHTPPQRSVILCTFL